MTEYEVAREILATVQRIEALLIAAEAVQVLIKLDVGGRPVEVTRGQFDNAWRNLVESWTRTVRAELSPEVAARVESRAWEEFRQLAEGEGT